jgi:hypothetical protein
VAKVYISLKDPDGIYEGVYANSAISKEDKEYLLSKFFSGGDYLDLLFDTETKELTIRPNH